MIRILLFLTILTISFSTSAERKFNLITGEYEEVDSYESRSRSILDDTYSRTYRRSDEYRISRDDALEADSYNRRADSLFSDYDNDGTSNPIDPYDNEWTKDPAFRDYDDDGTPNLIDPYDNDWYKE
jgi:hypothetical protein